MAAWSRKTLKKSIFFVFCGKTTPYRKFSKFCSKRIHQNTDRRVVFKFREIWLTEIRKIRSKANPILGWSLALTRIKTAFVKLLEVRSRSVLRVNAALNQESLLTIHLSHATVVNDFLRYWFCYKFFRSPASSRYTVIVIPMVVET